MGTSAGTSARLMAGLTEGVVLNTIARPPGTRRTLEVVVLNGRSSLIRLDRQSAGRNGRAIGSPSTVKEVNVARPSSPPSEPEMRTRPSALTRQPRRHARVSAATVCWPEVSSPNDTGDSRPSRSTTVATRLTSGEPGGTARSTETVSRSPISARLGAVRDRSSRAIRSMPVLLHGCCHTETAASRRESTASTRFPAMSSGSSTAAASWRPPGSRSRTVVSSRAGDGASTR